ncbi:MAG: biopolymer transporter ExbD [Myxococcota bacterium]
MSQTELRRWVRRRRPEPPRRTGLLLYPMMDALSVLLVCQLAQVGWAAGPKAASAIDLPYAASAYVADERSLSVLIATDGVYLFDGRPTDRGSRLLSLRDGRLCCSEQLQHGCPVVLRLKTTLRDRREEERDRGLPETRRVQIVADREVPFETIDSVLRTLAMTGYDQVVFAVFKRGGLKRGGVQTTVSSGAVTPGATQTEETP